MKVRYIIMEKLTSENNEKGIYVVGERVKLVRQLIGLNNENWGLLAASKVSETLSGEYKFELVQYMYILCIDLCVP